jgi:hypothetical protein
MAAINPMISRTTPRTIMSPFCGRIGPRRSMDWYLRFGLLRASACRGSPHPKRALVRKAVTKSARSHRCRTRLGCPEIRLVALETHGKATAVLADSVLPRSAGRRSILTSRAWHSVRRSNRSRHVACSLGAAPPHPRPGSRGYVCRHQEGGAGSAGPMLTVTKSHAARLLAGVPHSPSVAGTGQVEPGRRPARSRV